METTKYRMFFGAGYNETLSLEEAQNNPEGFEVIIETITEVIREQEEENI